MMDRKDSINRRRLTTARNVATHLTEREKDQLAAALLELLQRIEVNIHEQR